MSRSSRAKYRDGTKLKWLPSWESKYICHLALVTEKEYHILSVLTAMLPLALTDKINCLIKPPLQLYPWLGRLICMQVIHILKKLVTFWQLSWDKYMSLPIEQPRVWHRILNKSILILHDHLLYLNPENHWSTNRLGTLAIFFKLSVIQKKTLSFGSLLLILKTILNVTDIEWQITEIVSGKTQGLLNLFGTYRLHTVIFTKKSSDYPGHFSDFVQV